MTNLAAKHTTNGETMTDNDDTQNAQWHMDPALHAHCVETAAEIAEHFLDVRLTTDVPEWLAQREAADEGRER